MKKYIFLFLFFILLSGCKFKNTDYYPEGEGNGSIMSSYPWSLDMDKLSKEKADSIFDWAEANHGLDFSMIMITEPKVKIIYRYGPYGNKKKESFILKADNGENFSAREILFKINQETAKNMKGDPHYFFEGMQSMGVEDNMAVYEILQGS